MSATPMSYMSLLPQDVRQMVGLLIHFETLKDKKIWSYIEARRRAEEVFEQVEEATQYKGERLEYEMAYRAKRDAEDAEEKAWRPIQAIQCWISKPSC